MMQYRKDIDGLRAIAVVSVIFFHAKFELFRGGFVGVDIFFVISGYLITSIILLKRETGQYTIGGFYLGRARRLLPALFFILLVCLPFSWHWFLPGDLKDFGQSVVATTFFLSNVFFWFKTGYFDVEAELKPLLHTWSLAIEEQYYLFFPLLLSVLIRKSTKLLKIGLLILALASLTWAQIQSHTHPSANFFLFPSRIWELATGALIAIWMLDQRLVQPPKDTSRRDAYLTALGLASIGFSIFYFDHSFGYPSLVTLLPVLGTGLIIVFSKENTLIGAFLSSRFLVGLGLISYSAYLWHQPLFAFARYRTLGELSWQTACALIALTIVLAFLSWRFIENPLRRSKDRQSDIRFIALMGLCAVGLVAFGVGAHYTDGYSSMRTISNLPADYLKIAQVDRKTISGIDGSLCVSDTASLCRVSAAPSSSESLLLLGDSHSADLTNQFKRFADQQHINAWQMSFPGCVFLHSQIIGNTNCTKARDLILEKASAHAFSEILLVGNYFAHTQGHTDISRTLDIAYLVDFIEALLKTGTKVVLFTPRINFNHSPIRAAALNQLNAVVPLVDASNDEIWLEKLAKFKQDPRFVMFDQRGLLITSGCGMVGCFNGHTQDMKPIYRDASHLTEFGAAMLFEAYVQSRVKP
jgi:peptidoglycan/LPS O-acetylase OafA/YrhL